MRFRSNDPEPSPGFVFITQTGPVKSKNTEQQIRKHVMRNIGKSRRKEKRNDKPNDFTLEIPESFHHPNSSLVVDDFSLDEAAMDLVGIGVVRQGLIGTVEVGPLSYDHDSQIIPSDVLQQPHSQIGEQALDVVSTVVPRIERVWTGRMDPFIQYPIKMNRRTLQLMDHVFDERYGNTPPFRNAWLPVGMLHAAAFHQVLSNAALNLASLRAINSVPETGESMAHHTVAVGLVVANMANKSATTSDGVIGAITGFACYAHATGNRKGFLMHFDALKELVTLRGGFDTLYSNPILANVIFWVDVCGSVTEVNKPNFPIPSQIISPELHQQDIPIPLLTTQISNAWRWKFPDQQEIMNIMNDCRSYTTQLKAEVKRTNGGIYSEGRFAAHGILPLLHRALCLESDMLDDSQQKCDAVRLGCMLYFAEIRRLFGIMGILSKYQTQKLRISLQSQEDDWGALDILKAWVLAMGCIESSGAERAWFFQRLQVSRGRLGIDTWDELQVQFRDILWYGHVHDTTFKEVVDGTERVLRPGLLGGSKFGGYRPLLYGVTPILN